MAKGYGKVSLAMIAREAHVAVRTIYVKFGGKMGLLKAIIEDQRARFQEDLAGMECDMRPLTDILTGFGMRFLNLVWSPDFIKLYRMAIPEALAQPELAAMLDAVGPRQTREILARFFARNDIRKQLDKTIDPELQAAHLLSCLLGNQALQILMGLRSPPAHQEHSKHVASALQLFFGGVTTRQVHTSIQCEHELVSAPKSSTEDAGVELEALEGG